MLTYAVADYMAASGNAGTHLNGAIEPRAYYRNTILGFYPGYMPSVAVGVAQTFGVSAPSGQRSTVQGIEIKPIAA